MFPCFAVCPVPLPLVHPLPEETSTEVSVDTTPELKEPDWFQVFFGTFVGSENNEVYEYLVSNRTPEVREKVMEMMRAAAPGVPDRRWVAHLVWHSFKSEMLESTSNSWVALIVSLVKEIFSACNISELRVPSVGASGAGPSSSRPAGEQRKGKRKATVPLRYRERGVRSNMREDPGLREIRKMQLGVDPIFPLLPFSRLVREMIDEVSRMRYIGMRAGPDVEAVGAEEAVGPEEAVEPTLHYPHYRVQVINLYL